MILIKNTSLCALNGLVLVALNAARLFLRAWLLVTLVLLFSCAAPPGKVDAWPISNAEENAFSGQVVDMQCEISGNCADNCGSGKRQLGLKTANKGTVLVAKNLTNYSGSVYELLPYCGKTIEVSGLFTEHRGIRFFQIQNMRMPGGSWEKATRFSKAWTQRSGKPSSLAENWQVHDERVKAVIEQDGVLGLGKEADDEFLN